VDRSIEVGSGNAEKDHVSRNAATAQRRKETELLKSEKKHVSRNGATTLRGKKIDLAFFRCVLCGVA